MPLSRLDVFRICQEKYILIFGGIFVLGMILATVASHLEEVNWVLFWIGGGLAIIGFIPMSIFSLRAAFSVECRRARHRWNKGK